MSTCAVIPTYNNIDTVVDIVVRTLNYLPVILVADGPTDGSLEAVENIHNDNLVIVSYKKNKGKGYALKKGLKKARELGYSHAVTIDSDGQHYPEDIPQLLRMSAVRPEAIIIGSRQLKQDNMPGKNTFANRFSNFWFHIQTGFPIPDTQSGFRVYPLKEVHGLNLMTRRYEAELLLLVFSSWANTPIIPVPIRVYYPPHEERVTFFNPIRDFTRISILNTFLCVLAVIYGWPRSHWRFFAYLVPFLATIIGANLTCIVYALFPSKFSADWMRNRISKGARLLLTGFPLSRFRIYNKPDNKAAKNGPCVVIANHTSMLDVVTILNLYDKIVVIGQDWVIHNIFFGRIARRMGVITVSEGIESYLPKLGEYAKEGYNIAIFPEGTRSVTGEVLRFHRGAFYVAEQLNLPIQPILLRGYVRALRKQPFHVGASKEMSATFLPAIEPDSTKFGSGYRERARLVRAYYYDLLGKVGASD